ncbi:DUF6497 family protein [Roseovarius pelagicus]|uniref:DUF6497 family protein n=1 Tax=Roseovarius pelagicus TaxID=2980108 RepID=A0ABY6DGL1_9RHOB|nr:MULTISPECIES: DUF6497 family protein [Rhodobacterales]UXX84088.1 DUF6497 family protein [Roseovarius pelagicus]
MATTAVAATAEAAETALVLPSGLNARLHEVLTDRPGGGLVYRFRFVADGFDPRADQVEVVLDDLTYLCREYALARVSDIGPHPRQIVISLADKETEFGVADPTARQVFEAFAIENNTCIWEMF